MPKKEEKLVEVCRSFSYKMGLPKFENRDFFCSQKAEVPESEAVATSEALYEFCKSEVIKSVNKYKLENPPIPINQKPLGFKEGNEKSQDDQEKAEDLGREI